MARPKVGTKLPTRSALKAVQSLFVLLDASGMGYREIAKKAGVNLVTLSQWRHGTRAPNLQSLENVLEVLGHQLQVVKLPDPPDPG